MRRQHGHHERVARWIGGAAWLGLCPVVEGALVRTLMRLGESQNTATAVLKRLYEDRRFEFWTDAVSYLDVDLSHVTGYRQVTDAYLLALARSREAELATLDAGFASAVPRGVLLIP